jgi:hypothetical protein
MKVRDGASGNLGKNSQFEHVSGAVAGANGDKSIARFAVPNVIGA